MRLARIIVSIFALSAVAACSNAREALIPSKQGPDEFAVYTRAPLTLPPDYSLSVPAPGSERPQDVNPRDIAEQAVLGTTSQSDTVPQITSPGIEALLQNTGATEADPSIRQLVDQESSILALEDKTVMESIIFWQTPTTYGSAVDADEETKRIQENQALGQPLNTGEVPTIEKKQKGILEDVFN
jgi:hypothetical protein